MILITKEAVRSKKKLKEMIQNDHVVILDGKLSGVYPKIRVLSIHKRTPENIVAHALGLVKLLK